MARQRHVYGAKYENEYGGKIFLLLLLKLTDLLSKRAKGDFTNSSQALVG